jgi:hypothetical protein
LAEGDVAISNVKLLSLWKCIILGILSFLSGRLPRFFLFFFRLFCFGVTKHCGSIVGSFGNQGRILVEQPGLINIISQRWSRGLDIIKELGKEEENAFSF